MHDPGPAPTPAPAAPRLLLAPMEGLLDHTLRDVLTRTGGLQRCVSEFIRVTDTLLPPRAFWRIVPELRNGGRTAAGVPVRPQLLGSDASVMADNAARLVELGADGIDLNFGCPAKVVNRHGGGASLLREPERMRAIVQAVRRAVPRDVEVSAKMRLGWDDPAEALDCAQALLAGGADELVVHARTRADGYRPPGRWEHVARVREASDVPVVVNGEVWTAADAREALATSGCDALMLGRGMVADPGLARAIAQPGAATLEWDELRPLLALFWGHVSRHVQPRHRGGRLKQWLNYLRRRHAAARLAYDEVRAVTDLAWLDRWIADRSAGAGAGDVSGGRRGQGLQGTPGIALPTGAGTPLERRAVFATD